jgi:hypothetical protein
MSALPPIATELRTSANGSDGPIADICVGTDFLIELPRRREQATWAAMHELLDRIRKKEKAALVLAAL